MKPIGPGTIAKALNYITHRHCNNIYTMRGTVQYQSMLFQWLIREQWKASAFENENDVIMKITQIELHNAAT